MGTGARRARDPPPHNLSPHPAPRGRRARGPHPRRDVAPAEACPELGGDRCPPDAGSPRLLGWSFPDVTSSAHPPPGHTSGSGGRGEGERPAGARAAWGRAGRAPSRTPGGRAAAATRGDPECVRHAPSPPGPPPPPSAKLLCVRGSRRRGCRLFPSQTGWLGAISRRLFGTGPGRTGRDLFPGSQTQNLASALLSFDLPRPSWPTYAVWQGQRPHFAGGKTEGRRDLASTSPELKGTELTGTRELLSLSVVPPG